MSAAVIMIQIACLTLHTIALPEATIKIVNNVYSNISMTFCCRANRVEKCQRPFLCENPDEVKNVRINSVRYFKKMKNDTKATIYGKQFRFY